MKDKELRKSYYDKPCLVCKRTPSDPAHVQSYATTLEDKSDNMIPLCRKHHTEQHTIGWFYFCSKHKEVYDMIRAMGFKFDGHKLRRIE